MDTSIFPDKAHQPNDKDLSEALAENYYLWHKIKDYVISKYPDALLEWNHSGAKYGWSFRLKDKKRAIVYLLPRDKYFKAAFVFGQKATDSIILSNISNDIKAELEAAKVYAEGRGIRIDVRDEEILLDIKKLIDIKLAN
jgi:hypothetical protein